MFTRRIRISRSARRLTRVAATLATLAWASTLGLLHAGAAPAPDHILVKFRPQLARGSVAASTNLNDGLGRLAQILSLPGGVSFSEPHLSRTERAARRAARRDLASHAEHPNLDRFLYLSIPPGMTAAEWAQRIGRHPWVEYAEPDEVGTGGVVPSDPAFSSQWHHQNAQKPTASIDTPLAWDITQGSTNVIVAVLDTGLTPSAEFAGRTVPGFNFVSNNANTTDDHGHGTAVAGTVAANANNGNAVAGVDWRCRIMPVKVLDSANFGQYSWWAQGIDFAVNNGAKVINLSAGGGSSSSAITTAITNAIARGVIFVTITHNDGSAFIRYPGNLPEAITVGATDREDRRCGFSNFGSAIDLCAPGTNIYTVSRSGGVTFWWGTSFAAPQVAGVCALLAGLRPNLTQADARALLCAGAEDVVGDVTDTPGFDPYYGWGRLNAYHSVLLAQTQVDQIATVDGRVRLSWVSPGNAADKKPYLVESKSALNAAWTPTPESPGAFEYTSDRTYWTDPASATGPKFFRVRIRPLP